VAQHIELHENSVCELVQDKTILVKHVAVKINPADIFTKEMQDRTHFWHLCNSLCLVSLISFRNQYWLFIMLGKHHSKSSSRRLLKLYELPVHLPIFWPLPYLLSVALLRVFHLPGLHGFVPSALLMLFTGTSLLRNPAPGFFT
jgi:hypothetical protein